MISIRKSSERGNSHLGWLNSFHTFSFSDYYDPDFMGWGSLRVINEDTIQPGMGFGRHPHRNMEIISYVVEGELAHKDSMGTGSVIRPGEIQRISAGTGVEHSEFNHSQSERLHFLQIWIMPEENGIEPSYQQIKIPKQFNRLFLIGSREGKDDVIKIHQDVKLYAAYTTEESFIPYELDENRLGWVQLIKGKIDLNGHSLSAGDGAALMNESHIEMRCAAGTEFLLFDLV